MKLNYKINPKGEKEYTLKETSEKEIKPAHYKFIKIRDAPKSDVRFVRKNK